MVFLRDLKQSMQDEFIYRLKHSGSKKAIKIVIAFNNDQDIQIGDFFPDDKFKII